jgi:hypothetical protein
VEFTLEAAADSTLSVAVLPPHGPISMREFASANTVTTFVSGLEIATLLAPLQASPTPKLLDWEYHIWVRIHAREYVPKRGEKLDPSGRQPEAAGPIKHAAAALVAPTPLVFSSERAETNEPPSPANTPRTKSLFRPQ